MERKLIELIASRVDARIRCIADCKRPGHEHFAEWIERHKDAADALCNALMPSGGGFDCGTSIDWKQSKPERVVFFTEFHHMDQSGGYDSWTEHNVIVTPSLIHGLSMRVTGRNRNDIKDYLSEIFDHALTRAVDRETETKIINYRAR